MQRPLLVVFLVLAIALGGCATGRKMVRPNPHEPSDPRAAASSQTVAFAHLQPDEFDQPVAPAASGVDSSSAPVEQRTPTNPSAHGAAKTKTGRSTSAGRKRVDAQAKTQSTAKTVIYACPMHPDVTDTTASICPKCGMTLEPREEKP